MGTRPVILHVDERIAFAEVFLDTACGGRRQVEVMGFLAYEYWEKRRG